MEDRDAARDLEEGTTMNPAEAAPIADEHQAELAEVVVEGHGRLDAQVFDDEGRHELPWDLVMVRHR